MKNPEVDAYIEEAPEYARPILKKIRALFHKAYPKIEEELKWRVPSFIHKGIVGGMAAFKNRALISFWKGGLVNDPKKLFDVEGSSSGKYLTSVDDLPVDADLIAYIREAVALNENGIKVPMKKKSAAKKEVEVPDYFVKVLRKNKKALAAFEAFSPSHKREYVEWITEAKQEETRERRMSQAIEWMSQGKPRNWKYMNC